MLEILIVIGILVLLVTLLVVGVGHVIGSAKEKSTRVLMHTLRSLITEMEVSSGLTRQPDSIYVNGIPQKNPDIWHYYDNATKAEQGALYGKSSNKLGLTQVMHGAPERYTCDAVLNTQIAMGILQAVPANKTALTQLPADSFMEAPPAGTKLLPYVPTGGTPVRPQPPIPLDGWKNPIILVPSAGALVSVTDPSDKNKIVYKRVQSPDKRPFWASAGADGSFNDPEGKKATGEDNIYSFEE